MFFLQMVLYYKLKVKLIVLSYYQQIVRFSLNHPKLVGSSVRPNSLVSVFIAPLCVLMIKLLFVKEVKNGLSHKSMRCGHVVSVRPECSNSKLSYDRALECVVFCLLRRK